MAVSALAIVSGTGFFGVNVAKAEDVVQATSDQAAATTATDKKSDSGEVVTVTATRRATALQRTPLAITALSGSELSARGVGSLKDLSVQVPGLQIAPQIFGNLQVFLRGVGSTSNMETGDPAIAFHMDGVYVSRTTSTAGLMFDTQRVEVVKGPQGTLYGRNATGGSINVITNKPVFDYEGAASVEFGNYNQLTTSGMVNIPINDVLAARLSFQTSKHDGYIKIDKQDLGVSGNDRMDQDDYGARLHVLYKPNDKFSLLVTGDVAHQGGAGGGDMLIPLITGDAYKVNGKQVITRDNSFSDVSLEANYDLEWAQLTYIYGNRFSSLDRKYEYPYSNYPGYYVAKDRTNSHELRLTGQLGRLNWITGLFYFDEDMNSHLRIQVADPTWIYYPAVATSNSKAAFAQGTYDVTDKFRVTGGLRYTKDEKDAHMKTIFQTVDGTPTRVSVDVYPDGEWSSTDWKVGAEYDINPTSMAYMNIGTAYKAGGYFAAPSPNTYDPENLTAYEIGLKNKFFDNSLTLNLAAYYYDYTDLQITSLDLRDGAYTTITRNAASAEIKGIEAEFAYISDNYGKFDGSLAWTDAKYGDLKLPYGDQWVTGSADYSDTRMALAPEWSINLGYQYSWDFKAGSLTGRVQTHYESAKDMDYHHFAATHQDSFTKTDLTLTYEPNDANWTIQGYVRNLEDDAVLVTAIPPNGASSAYAQATFAPPRLYGVKVSAKF